MSKKMLLCLAAQNSVYTICTIISAQYITIFNIICAILISQNSIWKATFIIVSEMYALILLFDGVSLYQVSTSVTVHSSQENKGHRESCNVNYEGEENVFLLQFIVSNNIAIQ